MSAEKIIQQIKNDSQKEQKDIIKDAENQAKQIIQNAKNDAEIKSEKIINDGKKQSENQQKILISKANQDSKREIMKAKEEVIEDCFITAQEKLLNLNETEYKKTIENLIKNGQKIIGQNCKIQISKELDKEIAKKLGVEVIGRINATGGIIIQSNNGKITFDNTFEGIIKREKNKIRIKVGKLLFSEQ